VQLLAGRYELGEVLGRGGLAVTRRAVDRRLGRDVAVKTSAGQDRARFVREAHLLARFDHPGIVRVYEAFEDGGAAHLVMELLDGPSIAGLGRRLDAGEVAGLATGIGTALAAVHAAGLLHRDVSPSNVVLVAGRPVLVDFGLARSAADVTAAYTRMVTPGFAPPEQYGGDPARIGPPTDVYGMAATLYYACAGRLPANAVDRQHGARLEPLRRLRPDLPRAFCDGVHDGLELDPDHRPQTIDSFLARLDLPFFGTPVAPVATPAPKNDGARWPAVVPLAVLAAAAAVAAPVAATAALAAVALPALATVGDRRRGAAAWTLAWRFVANAARTVAAAAPAALLLAGGVATTWLVDRVNAATAVDDVVAAVTGVAAVAVVLGRSRPDPDALAAWSWRCRDGLLHGTWAAALLALAGALALRPDLWPLPAP
jgi:serine/threonine-protein kinase